MGIPALFRWLSSKYPKVTSQVIEAEPRVINDVEIPVDASQPNPNGQEFDNLYLDMNGIIHPCCHPEDKPPPETEDEMMIEIFKYIDRIFAMIRPRKLIYMAIDGVAPRAKMNQQRSRRFRAAREETIKREEEEKVKKLWEDEGREFPAKETKHFDSNCITPGTPFMAHLATCLRYYIKLRLNTDPGWRKVSVLLSDASYPGEGEHKIMDFIRRQRNTPDYDANTSHVLYGLDADLIMLALATHEPRFHILREDVFYNEGKDQKCFICGQKGHYASTCTGKVKEKIGEFDEKTVATTKKPYVFLHVSILREYLAIEMEVLDLSFKPSLERALDDWVFMCFFVGNDFLPHLPSLEIREGAIDTLIGIWKKNVSEWGGYLTDSGRIHLGRVEKMMGHLGLLEDQVFQKRREIEEKKRQNRINKRLEAHERSKAVPVDEEEPEILAAVSARTAENAYNNPPAGASMEANRAAAERLKASFSESSSAASGLKRKIQEADEVEEVLEESEVLPASDIPILESVIDDDIPEDVAEPIPPREKIELEEEADPEDNIRLWESGWKERYYRNKFSVELDNLEFRASVVNAYVEGLCWVLKYYYQGVQSWKWYFPYHYAPFASDFTSISKLSINFELGTPFRPIEQLMGVLPAASKEHIPEPLRWLMEDESSPIIDFYPVDFPIDMNGKKHAWQGVALLPFIDEDRLLNAVQPLYEKLTEEEITRNSKGEEELLVSMRNPIFEELCKAYGKKVSDALPLKRSYGSYFEGTVQPHQEICLPGSTVASPLYHLGQDHIEDNHTIAVYYYMPEYPANYIFKAQLLKGAIMPKTVLDEFDKRDIRINFHGRNSYGRRSNRNDNYDNREAAARFIKHGITPNPEAYGYDTRKVRDSSDYKSRDDDSYKRPRRYEQQYPRHSSSETYGSGYTPNSSYSDNRRNQRDNQRDVQRDYHRDNQRDTQRDNHRDHQRDYNQSYSSRESRESRSNYLPGNQSYESSRSYDRYSGNNQSGYSSQSHSRSYSNTSNYHQSYESQTGYSNPSGNSNGFLNSLMQNSHNNSEFTSQSEWAGAQSGNIGWNRNLQSSRRGGNRRY